jgi:hypothetical protein
LGKGRFSTVSKVKMGGYILALKKTDLTSCVSNVEASVKEIDILKLLINHPSIIQLFGYELKYDI